LFGATSRQEWIARVHRVEDLGYSVLQVPDHLGNQFAPILALMAAAEASTTLRLGTLVLDINYRHLALLAKEAATLDLLSEGRFELGLDTGWIARESQMTGIPFDPAGQRVGRLEEAVHLLTRLLFLNVPHPVRESAYERTYTSEMRRETRLQLLVPIRDVQMITRREPLKR